MLRMTSRRCNLLGSRCLFEVDVLNTFDVVVSNRVFLIIRLRVDWCAVLDQIMQTWFENIDTLHQTTLHELDHAQQMNAMYAMNLASFSFSKNSSKGLVNLEHILPFDIRHGVGSLTSWESDSRDPRRF